MALSAQQTVIKILFPSLAQTSNERARTFLIAWLIQKKPKKQKTILLKLCEPRNYEMSRKVKGTTKIGINFKNDYINRAEKM